MSEPILARVRRGLEENRGRWPEITKAKDVPYDFIAKVAQGRRTNPTLGYIQLIVDWLDEQDEAKKRLVAS